MIANVTHHLRMSHDFEGQAGMATTLAPFGRAANRVAVHKQGWSEAMQIGSEVNGRRRFADAAFVACDGDYHLFGYTEWWICILYG